eukprot:10866313-Ditylum_brightwellii.AAC.1
MQQLRTICSTIIGDCAQFQSGSYPFRGGERGRTSSSYRRHSGGDMNDPRNRATSYMDVTIIGEQPIPWAVSTCAAYVHSYVENKKDDDKEKKNTVLN